MKWKNIVLGSAFIGVFTLGAMFAPIGEPRATTNNKDTVKNLSVVQTANEKDTPADQTEFTCPMTGGPMGSGAGMGMGMGNHFAGSMSTVIAETLGMTVDELQTARSEGKSVADLAKEKGIKVDTIVAKMVESRKADLEKLVKDGKMTQEQMDAMTKNMEAMMKTMLERDTTGPMMGRGGGMMGMGNGGRGNTGTTNQQFN